MGGILKSAVYTVQVERCFSCHALLDPQQPPARRQMMTKVSQERGGELRRYYELVILCPICEDREVAWEVEEAHRRWCRRFWIVSFVVTWAVSVWVPVGFLPWYGALLIRGCYKWGGRIRGRPRPRSPPC